MYYSNGDFGYNNRSRDIYKVPYEADYDGSDTLFHWKHKGSIYIKTGNSFNAIKFKIQHLDKEFELRLETNEESTDEEVARNNNKDTKLKHYKFNRFEEKDGITRIIFNLSGSSTTKADLFKSLFKDVFKSKENIDKYLFAEDKPVFKDLTDDYDKVQDGAVKGIGVLRVKRSTLLNKVNKNFERGNKIEIITETRQERFSDNILEALFNIDQKLNSFYIGNDSDYFIHKNLLDFLTQEKERYIKNHILSDLNSILDGKLDNTTIIIAKAFDLVSSRIIEFLSAIEEFQKKLFTMKKNVVESEYCLTIDNIDEKHYPEILKNKAQLAEWEYLFKVKTKDVSTLKKHPTLVLDTRFFRQKDGTNPFKDKVLSIIEHFSERTNGLLINSENYQALRLLEERYREQVKCIYIDPPYNSGNDDFIYKDNFRNSSWLSMLNDRIEMSKRFLRKDGIFYSSIDDKDSNNKVSHRLMTLVEDIFGKTNYVENVIWTKNTTHNDAKTFSHNHEYVLCYTKDKSTAIKDHEMFRQAKPGFAEVEDLLIELNKDYPPIAEVQEKVRELYREHQKKYKKECLELGLEWNNEVKKADPWKGIIQYKFVEYRTEKRQYVEEKDAKKTKAQLWVFRESDPSWPNANTLTKEHKSEEDAEYRFYLPLHPKTQKPCPAPSRGWLWKRKKNLESGSLSFEEINEQDLIYYGEGESKVPQYKRFLKNVDTDVIKSTLTDFTDGEKELANIQGSRGTFPNPKPTTLLRKLIGGAYSQNGVVMDYFAGSGTTGHALLALNQFDEGHRKYILVEMGKYFDSTLKVRIQRVIFSLSWKDGIPKLNNGCPNHIFKYITLEQYEDVLDAIEQFEGKTPENLPLKYLYKPELNKIQSTIDLGKPFNNLIKYGQPTKEGYVDLVDTCNYLQGYEVKSLKTYTLNKKYYKIVETQDTLVVWRDIMLKEDDSNAVFEIAEKYPNILAIQVNHDFNMLAAGKGGQVTIGKREVTISIIHADDFNQ